MNPGKLGPLIAIVVSNALPVYAAAMGELTFFQIIYLYWVESLLLILFSSVKIGFASGTSLAGGKNVLRFGERDSDQDDKSYNAWTKVEMIFWFIVGRSFVLCFYLVFLILFIALLVTGRDNMKDMAMTLIFRNDWFNAALLAFAVSMLVQLVTGFFINGQYRIASPRSYNAILDGRVLLIHVMTVSVVILHKFIFEGKAYAARGEVIYVGLFMLVKCLGDIFAYRSVSKAGDEEERSPYI